MYYNSCEDAYSLVPYRVFNLLDPLLNPLLLLLEFACETVSEFVQITRSELTMDSEGGVKPSVSSVSDYCFF